MRCTGAPGPGVDDRRCRSCVLAKANPKLCVFLDMDCPEPDSLEEILRQTTNPRLRRRAGGRLAPLQVVPPPARVQTLPPFSTLNVIPSHTWRRRLDVFSFTEVERQSNMATTTTKTMTTTATTMTTETTIDGSTGGDDQGH